MPKRPSIRYADLTDAELERHFVDQRRRYDKQEKLKRRDRNARYRSLERSNEQLKLLLILTIIAKCGSAE